MKLACGDHSFPLLEHELVCDLVRSLGFEGIDIGLMGNRSHVRPEVIREDLAGWAGRIEERVVSRGLEIADVFLIPWTDNSVMAVNHPTESERERSSSLFSDMLEFGRRLGAPGMTVLPGMEFDGVSHEQGLKLAASELRRRVEEAAHAGLRLSVEPHVGSIIQDPAEAARLLEMTDGLYVSLDHTHFIRQGYSQQDCDSLYARTRHYHARGACPGRLQAPIKENTIDFERVVTSLREIGYNDYLAVEYVWIDWERCNECDNLSETVLLRDRLRAILTDETRSLESA